MLPENKISEKQIEMSRNKQEFNRCNRIYLFTAIPNLGAMALMIISSVPGALYSLLNAQPERSVSSLICGVLLCPVACALAMLCGYLKKDILSLYALLPIAAAFLLNIMLEVDGDGNPLIAAAVTLITAAPTIYANHRYRYLETQEGFPHFSELLNEQQKKSEEFKEHDPYEEAAKRRKLTASREMTGLELNGKFIAPKTTGNNDQMESI